MDDWIIARMMEDLATIKRQLSELNMAINATYNITEKLNTELHADDDGTEPEEPNNDGEEPGNDSSEPDPFAELRQPQQSSHNSPRNVKDTAGAVSAQTNTKDKLKLNIRNKDL